MPLPRRQNGGRLYWGPSTWVARSWQATSMAGTYLALRKQRPLCFKVLSHSCFISSALLLPSLLTLTHKRLVLAYPSSHAGAMVKISTDFAAFVLPTHQNKSSSHIGYEAQQPPNQFEILNEEERARRASWSQLGPAQHLVNHAIGSSGQPSPNSSYKAVS